MVKVRQRYSDNLKVLKEARASEIVQILAEDEDEIMMTSIPYKDDDEGPRVMPKKMLKVRKTSVVRESLLMTL